MPLGFNFGRPMSSVLPVFLLSVSLSLNVDEIQMRVIEHLNRLVKPHFQTGTSVFKLCENFQSGTVVIDVMPAVAAHISL